MSCCYDGKSSWWPGGMEITGPVPPRLLGEGCSCLRIKVDEVWKLSLCPLHAEEVRRRGSGILFD